MADAIMAQPFPEIFGLTLAEKIQLVEDLWDNIAAEAQSLPLTDWQRAELERREAEYRLNPGLATSWEDAKERILRKHGR
jgi:putative addiction module component (TIGR02574 family)